MSDPTLWGDHVHDWRTCVMKNGWVLTFCRLCGRAK